ncbi:putative polygalacturonase 2 [Rhexocercosporidium sp. MPI-PUGE-AT-0058]|nr:putative polygalacturonase 2 [Rhexocercosporidium sp. MPI-PUGE-AT-0058]
MVQITTLSLLATAASLVSAVPTTLYTSASCTFSGATGAAAVAKGKAACATITLSNLVVPAGTTLDLTKLTKGTKVIFEGTTTFGYEEWSGPLISVSGTNIAVSGAAGNVIDGGGARWWDTKGSNGGKTKPKFFYAHGLTTSSITGLNFKNSPVQLMSINGANTLDVTNIHMDNTAGDVSALGHNTDAFDVGSSTGVTISGANIQNQDDCLAINSGTSITFTGGTCSGGHGLSIGSVGGRSDNTVKTVNILSSTIKNSDNGVRIKTVSGATGSVSGVTYKNIVLSNIAKYGIVIEQDYENGSPTGTPTTGVPITGLTISGITGSVASSASRVYILCGKGSCSNWTWSGVTFTGGKTSTKCLNIPSGGAAC